MRGAVEVELIAAGPDVQADGDLVAHRPRGKEQRRVLAEKLGHPLLQRVDGRVEPALLVADLRLRHRPAHGLGGPGLGVGVQVDRVAHAGRTLASAAFRWRSTSLRTKHPATWSLTTPHACIAA